MHTTLCTCSPLRVPPGTHTLPRGGEEGSSVNDAQCEAGLKHSCQARASLDAPRRPEGRRRTRRVEARAPGGTPGEGAPRLTTLMTVQLLRSSTVVSRCIFKGGSQLVVRAGSPTSRLPSQG